MKLIYKGKFNGDVNTLPHGEHKPGAVKFKEFDDSKTLGIVANIIGFVLTIGLLIVFAVRAGVHHFSVLACLASILCLFPHEIIIMFSMR